MKFKVIMTYDKEYEGYVVDVPELTGCMSQGKTLDEALNNIRDAIKGWLEVEKEHGRFNTESRDEECEIFLGEVLV
ncbi:MAG: type II toxin-antitoxin system HicB family antitoxin [Ignavibacteriales bacterium]|nr:type II toxin-antitoxin system HicB family antitoxin [Ignavibacteriales bacterium]MBK7380912.1 type II toxin-antitoxin system HicB family antitoxin [Ignavibacteriales bacterium]